MSRKPIGERPMTDAERQARCRAARAADRPIIRFRRPADRRSRAKRWRDAVDELVQLQAEYQAWLDALPEMLVSVCCRPRLWRERSDLAWATVSRTRGAGRRSC